ncbi:glycosyl hydrolase family 28-related protein [Kiritimatiellota bacterium B12222]|nr:glycosyl hydrolase family 28-related protein [Kiritimatiellota bacterium B12222]
MKNKIQFWICGLLCFAITALSATIDPVSYGAVPDDGLDDKAAIQLALNALESGDTLSFPTGTFDVSTTILRDSLDDVTISGQNGTIIKKMSGFSGEYLFYTRFSTDVRVSNIEFQGLYPSGIGWGKQGLYFGSTIGTIVEFCTFKYFGDAALRITTSSADVAGVHSFDAIVADNHFYKCTQVTTTQSSNDHGGTDGLLVEGNLFEEMRGSLKFATRQPGAQNVGIYDNHFLNGIGTQAITVNYYSDLEIRGNLFENQVNGTAVSLYPNTSAPAPIEWGNISIIDNDVYNCDKGIYFVGSHASGPHTDFKYVDISYNYFDGIGSGLSGVIYMRQDDPTGVFDTVNIRYNGYNDIHSSFVIIGSGDAINVTQEGNVAGLPPANCILDMKLDLGHGSIAYDSSPYNNLGALINGPLWVSGATGLEFDGVNDYVDCGNDGSLNFGSTTDFSIGFQAQIEPTSYTYATLLGKKLTRAVNRPGYHMRLEGHKLVVAVSDGVNQVQAVSAMDVDDGVWREYSFDADRDGDLIIYIDGVQDGAAVSMSSVGNIDNLEKFCLGTIGARNSYWFDGAIKDIWVLEAVLDPAIALDMILDEATGLSAYDASMYGNSGVLVNGPAWLPDGGGLDFDGVNDYVNCGDDSSLNFGSASDFSLGFQAQVWSTSFTYATLMGKKMTRAVNRAGYHVRLENHKLVFAVSDGVNQVQAVSAMDVDDGLWREYTLLADRNGDMAIYIDGVQNGAAVSMASLGNIDTSEDFCLGTIGAQNSFWLDGALKDVWVLKGLATP